MNHDHLMGWPAALLCVEQESNGEAAQKRARKQFWESSLRALREKPPAAWLEFERKKFEAEKPAAKPADSSANCELRVGDLVFVTKENEWIHVGAICRVEEVNSNCALLAHSPKNSRKEYAIGVSKEAKAMGMTQGWYLDRGSFTRE